MNSAPASTARSSMNWKASTAASLLLVSLGLNTASATPMGAAAVPNLRHTSGDTVSVQRIAGSENMFRAQASCGDIQPYDCYDALYDVCPDSGCSSGCNCVLVGHNIGTPPNDGTTDPNKCRGYSSGEYTCAPFLDGGTSGAAYIKMDPYAVANADMVITRDQTCPPSGPNAVVASVHHDRGCVYVGQPEPSWGVSVYPVGGSPYRRSIAEDTLTPASLQKRADCTMDVESQTDTYSTSKIVSETVDCRGKQSDCSIDVGRQHTETVETNWSLESGFSDFGFSVGASFGGSYSTSDTSSLQNSITVNAGAEGYLTYYVEATRFTGIFRGCDQDGQRGSVYALKNTANNPAAAHYAVVNTNR